MRRCKTLHSSEGTKAARLLWEHGALSANSAPLKSETLLYSPSRRSCKTWSYLPNRRARLREKDSSLRANSCVASDVNTQHSVGFPYLSVGSESPSNVALGCGCPWTTEAFLLHGCPSVQTVQTSSSVRSEHFQNKLLSYGVVCL